MSATLSSSKTFRVAAGITVTGLLALGAQLQANAQSAADAASLERSAPLALRAELQGQRNAISKNGWGFTVGITPATGKTFLAGLKAPDAAVLQAAYAAQQKNPVRAQVVPPKVGAVTTGKATDPKFSWVPVLSAIRNQGSCGSCWDFSSTSTFESAVRIYKGVTVDLSEQQILNCNANGYSCSGGWFDGAFNYEINHGQCTEATLPYTAAKGTCVEKGYAYKATAWAYVPNTSGTPTTAAIKSALVTYGPVSCAVYADSYFMNYKTGLFSNTYATKGANAVNHAVNIVGWDDSTGTWIMRNSWSTGWGEAGYMRIKYGANNIGSWACYLTGVK